jgi:NAD(P)-dependent dehydrogenase (short-subunit alcohol dehydrogenase family)
MAVAIAGDVSLEKDVVRLFDEATNKLGPITHVVNNAGITGRSSRLDAAEAATFRACIDLNVTGAILVAREAVRRMAPRHGGKGGAIVNISSAASNLGSPGEYVWYAASKGAIDSFTIGLARKWQATISASMPWPPAWLKRISTSSQPAMWRGRREFVQ